MSRNRKRRNQLQKITTYEKEKLIVIARKRGKSLVDTVDDMINNNFKTVKNGKY